MNGNFYRYLLARSWDASKPRCVFVMLNPSTATAETDDPTILKCRGFARRLGFGGFSVVNLFAWRATKPAALKLATDPIGPENDQWIRATTSRGETVIVAWGSIAARHGRRIAEVIALMPGPLWCIGTTKDGHPRHPLMTAYSTPATPWTPSQPAAPFVEVT